MNIDFYKMAAFGRHFLLIDLNKQDEFPQGREALSEIAWKMCRRVYGIGADGIIFWGMKDREPNELIILNFEGEEIDNLGDALYCFGRYAFDMGLTNMDQYSVIANGRSYALRFPGGSDIRLDLGSPLRNDGTELKENPHQDSSGLVNLEGQGLVVTPVNLGQRAWVVILSEEEQDWRELHHKLIEMQGADLYHPVFIRVYDAKEVEVLFLDVKGRADHGACLATAAIGAIVNGLADRSLHLHFRGNKYLAHWQNKTNVLTLESRASYIFTGNYYIREKE